jgi:uncharacterized membrane protein YbhN (UPF0104 family)
MSLLGQLLMLASFVLIIMKVIQYDIDFSFLSSLWVYAGLLGASLCFGCSIFLTSFNFRWLLYVLSGALVSLKLAVPIYCGSNLYKYLPGNFMHFVGRNRLAVEVKELNHAHVALATIIDNIFLCLSALIIAAVCTYNYLAEYIKMASIPPYVFAAAGAVIAILCVLAVVFQRRLRKLIRKGLSILTRFSYRAMIRLLGVTALRLLVLSATYLTVLALLGPPLGLDLIIKIIGIFVISWVIGFLIPGAPGGLGVREAILIMFLGNTLNREILTVSAIVHRVVCILGDLAAYGMALIYAQVNKDKLQVKGAGKHG